MSAPFALDRRAFLELTGLTAGALLLGCRGSEIPAGDPEKSYRLDLFLSLDGGGTFAPWSTGMEGTTIVSLEFDPLGPNLVWASCADGRLFVRNLP